MQKATKPTKKSDITRVWHLIDANGMTLGRMTTGIAELLMGKKKSYFVRNLDCGDYVVVVNAKNVQVTGNKDQLKIYTRYSGYPGGLKKEAFRDLLARSPEKVVEHAVLGMLPNNRLRDRMLTRLHVYAGAEHPYADKFKQPAEKTEEKK